VAFSGGVDSSLLFAVAMRTLNASFEWRSWPRRRDYPERVTEGGHIGTRQAGCCMLVATTGVIYVIASAPRLVSRQQGATTRRAPVGASVFVKRLAVPS
jgi:hypothetical protein